jgi:hypothetical protein
LCGSKSGNGQEELTAENAESAEKKEKWIPAPYGINFAGMTVLDASAVKRE